MPALYPIFLDLAGSLCVIIGGGRVAERKALGLLEAGATVRIVGLSFTPELERLGAEGRIELVRAPCEPAHVQEARLVLAATDDRRVNADIARTARALGAEVNVADSPEESSFHVPAVSRRGALTVAVSTGGVSPGTAASIARSIEESLPPGIAPLLELHRDLREVIRKQYRSIAKRQAASRAMVRADDELREMIRESGMEAAKERALEIVAEAAESARSRTENRDCFSSSSD
jgi:precorrin-2 dehydrogenase/sirohydrochlorin ferrochelatase